MGAQILAALVTGGLSSLLLTWGMTRGTWRLPQDQPNDRSLHDRPMPRSGGVGIVAGMALCSLLFAPDMGVLLSLTLVLAAVSFIDDWRDLSAFARLLAQLAAGIVFVATTLVMPHYGAGALCVLAIVWMANLYNFMDGADGLAGGMAVFGFGTYAVAAVQSGDAAVATVSAGIAASAAGFLVFNFPPARIFMGDVGSVPLGFVAAALGAVGWQKGLWPAWFPVMVFAPFVLDASVTLARRAWKRERVWQAHRDHYYQRLVRMGWGHRKTAIAEYMLMAASACAALAASATTVQVQMAIVAAAALAYVLLIAGVEFAWHRFRGGSAA